MVRTVVGLFTVVVGLRVVYSVVVKGWTVTVGCCKVV